MKQKRNWLMLPLLVVLWLSGVTNTWSQSSDSGQSGNFDVPGLNEPSERYEVFLGEAKFLVQITVSVNSNSDADNVELRDEGFGGDVRARIFKGTSKTIVLSTKLLALRPNRDRRALGSYQITVLGPAR